MSEQASPETRSIVVIGGGVVGLASALALQARGLAVTLVERDGEPRGASWGNAGHIATEQCEPLASWATIRSLPGRLFARGGAVGLPPVDARHWLPFAARLIRAAGPARVAAGRSVLTAALAEALPAWRRLLGGVGASELLREDGHFVVWESAATAATGRKAWAAAATGTATFRDASADELGLLTRLVGRRPAGAIRFAGSAQIGDLGALATALSAAFAARGGRRIVASVERIEDGPTVLLSGERPLRADAVLVAAGARSGTLLGPLGHRVPLIAERGYHLQAAAPDWPADTPPVVMEDRALILTRFAGGLRAASFVEFGGVDSPPDPRKWQRLRDHCADLGLDFAEAQPWQGARPTLPDYLPAIGTSGRVAGVHYAFGHQHLGLTLAAVTGEAVAALVAGGRSPLDLAPLSLDRFG